MSFCHYVMLIRNIRKVTFSSLQEQGRRSLNEGVCTSYAIFHLTYQDNCSRIAFKNILYVYVVENATGVYGRQ
jgi:hypothetical protein